MVMPVRSHSPERPESDRKVVPISGARPALARQMTSLPCRSATAVPLALVRVCASCAINCKQCSKRGFNGETAAAAISLGGGGTATTEGGGTKVATLTAAAAATMGFGGAGSSVSGSLLVVVPLPTGSGGLTVGAGGRAGAGIQIVLPLPASRVSHSRMLRCGFSDSTRNRKPAWPGLVQANSQPPWIGRAA